MGPTRTVKNKKTIPSSKGPNKSGSLGAKTKSKISKKIKAPPPKQQKTTSATAPVKKKKRVYTDKELGLPKLNMIMPVGVNAPKGKKKGKIFVDDAESMMTIMAIVNANKEGQIESKMMKSRQLEEIREARRKEAELRQEQKKSKLEETKDSIRKKRKRKPDSVLDTSNTPTEVSKTTKASRKRVSFA